MFFNLGIFALVVKKYYFQNGKPIQAVLNH
jgi:hypothetical protein